MSIHGYIREIYFPGVKIVLDYDVQNLNIRLLSICRQMLRTVQGYRIVKEMDWFSLKLCTNKIHGIYRLLYKMISVMCQSHESGIPVKCPFYTVQYGPQPIEMNINILETTLTVIHNS